MRPMPANDDNEAQIISAILGALIGALVGGLVAFLIGEHARKKQIELNEVENIRQKIKKSSGAIVTAQNNLQNLLVMSLKNAGHFGDMTKGIYDSKTQLTTFTMSLAQLYQIEKGLSEGMLNVNLVIQWDALETEVMLHNANIKEFNDYYTFLRTSIHTAQLGDPKALNVKTIASDSGTIANGATQNIDACAHFRGRCLQVLALLECHVEQYKKIDYKTVGLEELEKYQMKLIEHNPTEKEIEKKYKEEDAKYTAEKAFKVNVHSS